MIKYLWSIWIMFFYVFFCNIIRVKNFLYFYVNVSKMSWNCYFSALTFLRIHWKLLDFSHTLYIFSKKLIFSNFFGFALTVFVVLFVKLIQHVFSVYQLNTKHIYWANVVQKFKIVNLDFNLASRLIQVCRIQWWYLLFALSIGNTLLIKFGPQTQCVSLWGLVPKLI